MEETIKISELEAQFLAQVQASKLPPPRQQVELIEGRKWRYDFVWEEPYYVVVEIHGGVYSRGRHVRGKGFTEDRRKINAATLSGWLVLEYTAEMLDANEAIPELEMLFEAIVAEASDVEP